jgi:hypothetical protein
MKRSNLLSVEQADLTPTNNDICNSWLFTA